MDTEMTRKEVFYALREAIIDKDLGKARGLIQAIIEDAGPDDDSEKIVITNTQEQRVSQMARVAAVGGWVFAGILLLALAYVLSGKA